MTIKSISLPTIQNEIEARKTVKFCAIYLFVVSSLHIILALIKFGAWSFNSSDTYFRILENFIFGFAILRFWRAVLFILFFLQVLTLAHIVISDLNLKIINTISLVVLIFASIAVYRYHEIKNHIAKGWSRQ